MNATLEETTVVGTFDNDDGDPRAAIVRLKAIRLIKLRYGPSPDEERQLCNCCSCQGTRGTNVPIYHSV